jgi:hypothetical protein
MLCLLPGEERKRYSLNRSDERPKYDRLKGEERSTFRFVDYALTHRSSLENWNWFEILLWFLHLTFCWVRSQRQEEQTEEKKLMVHFFVGRLFQSLQLRQLITIVSGFWSIVTDLEYALRLSSFSWVYHLRSLISVSFVSVFRLMMNLLSS